MSQQAIDPRQLDAIREVVNIGAGHAATALHTLTNLRVMISVPRIQWAEESRAVQPALPGEGPLVMISVPVLGSRANPDERASLILARDAAIRMVSLLLRREPGGSGELGELERSTLRELGNIVCASYVGVLGTFLGEGVMIGTPELVEGTRAEVSQRTTRGLMIETDFSFLDSSFAGVFMLSHSETSFASLLDTLGLSGRR